MGFVQVGAACQRLSYFRLARLVLLSFMGLLHVALQIQFGIVALMHRTYIGWMSVLTFIICNILGQLSLVTCKATPWLRFKVRNFEVLTACYVKYMEVAEMDGSDDSAPVVTHQPTMVV